VQARAAAPERWQDRLTPIERALALRSQRLHGLVGSGTCSCGLVLSAGQPLEDADGHLDLSTWLPAYAFVVRSTGDDRAYVAVCGCGWRESHLHLPGAQESVTRHTTESAARLHAGAH
jgi:hypothetical protein